MNVERNVPKQLHSSHRESKVQRTEVFTDIIVK